LSVQKNQEIEMKQEFMDRLTASAMTKEFIKAFWDPIKKDKPLAAKVLCCHLRYKTS
jgi:hypothetical protein